MVASLAFLEGVALHFSYMRSLYRLSAKKLRSLFVQGDISAVEIAKTFLERAQRDKETRSFLSLFSETMLLQAERLDQKRARKEPLGRLAAVPIAMKDNIHIEGEITSCASQFLRNYRAPFDATVTRLFREEDALFLGKTNLDEFAMGSSTENSSFFSSKNPWDLTRVPGGSSGGSSAAVAARLAPIATGTDTGGSIRQPAAFCGIVGFKPTYGRVSRYGLVAFGSSLDQIGPMTTTVEDAALTMEVLGRHCPCDATSLPLPPETYSLTPSLEGVQFGVPFHFLENLSREAKENFQKSLQVCKDLGATIVEVDLDILKHSISVYYILASAEASTNLARFDGIRYGERSSQAKNLEEIYELSRKEGFGAEVKRRILLGAFVLSSGFQDAFYTKAQKVRARICHAFDTAFGFCDAVLLPTSPTEAFEEGAYQDPMQLYLQDVFTIPANMAGLPSISIPSGFDSLGLPRGLQILGPQLCDTAILQYAYAFEQATLYGTIPPLFDKEML